MSITKIITIRAVLGLRGVSDNVRYARAVAILTAMTGNASFPAPPVDMATFKTLLDSYSAAIAEALDGGAKAIAARNELREQVILAVRQLAVYVETVSKGSMSVFTSSGFQPLTTTRTAAQRPSAPLVRKVAQGVNSGDLLVSIGGAAPGDRCDLHYAPYNGTTPTTWALLSPVRRRGPVTVSGLTPGTVYAFQVRAMNASGYSDWSDSVTRMAI